MKKESISKQGGATLLILMLILTLTVSTVLLTGTGRKDNAAKRDHTTSDVLAKAKNALKGYAYRNEGELPCPDSTGDGLSDSPCAAVSGWLPWQTLGVKVLRDGDGVCLRYAVSSSYKGVAPASLVDGDFEVQNVNNVTQESEVVAVILAPLKQWPGQTRSGGTTCGAGNSDDYLDTISGVNNGAVGPVVFVQAEFVNDGNDEFNDALTWLNTSDITGSIPSAVSCGVGEELVGGVCQAIACDAGEELVGGVCQAIVCGANEELIGSTCVACNIGEELVGGSCQAIVCAVDEQLVNGVCEAVQACDAGYTLDGDGVCVDSDGCEVGETLNPGGQCKNTVCPAGYTANAGGQCKKDK